jgi:hypothetical protein
VSHFIRFSESGHKRTPLRLKSCAVRALGVELPYVFVVIWPDWH